LLSSSSTIAEQNSVQSFVYGKASETKRQSATASAAAQNQPGPSAEEETARRELAAREEGFREGELRARTQLAQEIQAARALIGNAVDSFAKSRNHYFEHVEAEVVRLALTIAAKILHREAQMEPLLLRGAVRVALEKLSANSQVILRVAPEKEAAWRTHFMTESHPGPAVEILPDASLAGHACSLDTAVGQIDLSIDGQLKEIEQGFFDLLARRPIQS
jgi:flagellar assembly protein FliH